jgi:hypothetical protein
MCPRQLVFYPLHRYQYYENLNDHDGIPKKRAKRLTIDENVTEHNRNGDAMDCKADCEREPERSPEALAA